jgi:hypothetical protein
VAQQLAGVASMHRVLLLLPAPAVAHVHFVYVVCITVRLLGSKHTALLHQLQR